ncbi:putative FBD domain, leucine-rich repeat domain superfamily, F-box-like domain superfamily [Helianthus annuus]|nr:putative FBD domain, leucine-rich repeat domain superfamily, F-box-like domain superfamily [Helianthus annuus]
MDMFKKLPHTIIENILCLVPIQEAARTSILSKEWRYHWTKIPKLVFDEETFQVLGDVSDQRPRKEERVSNIQNQREGTSYWCKLFYAFYQILLKHEGPIHEFTLNVLSDETCDEIYHIINYALRNYSVKKLTIDITWAYLLPLSMLSFHQLTDLHLDNCDLGYRPMTFNVFDSLTNLYLRDVDTSKKTLLHLISSCPLLKSLTLMIDDSQGFDESLDFEEYSLTNLFECFPTVENLSTCFSITKYFDKDGVPQVLPTSLIYLKYVYIDEMSFMYEYGLPFLLFLIRSSPNMEKLKLRVNADRYCHKDPILQSQKCSSTLKGCSDILLEHLKVIEISDLWNINTKPTLDFVKFIMSKSPALKKVRISLHKGGHRDDGLQVSEVLLSSQSASPMVDIIVENDV